MNPKICPLLFFVCLSVATSSFSQPAVFSSVKVEELRLSAAQKARFNTWTSQASYRHAWPITIRNLRQVQNQGRLTLTLPDDPRSYPVTPLSIDYYDEFNYRYRGEIMGSKGEGECLLIAKEGTLFGKVTVDGRSFLIQDLGQGQNVLLEYHTEGANTVGCGTTGTDFTSKPEAQIATTAQSRTEAAGVIVRILVVYTPAAEAHCDPEQLAEIYMDDLNEIMFNSRIAKELLRFELAGVKPWDFVESPAEPEKDREALRDDFVIGKYRDITQADLVVGLTMAEYRVGETFIGGIAEVDSVHTDVDAHALVRVDQPIEQYTFAHEVAHHFGCRHSVNNDPDGPTFAHGYIFITGPKWNRTSKRTLMGVSNNPRIPYVSTPYATYMDDTVGTIEQENNGRQLRLTATTISEYRDYIVPITLFVELSGPAQASGGESVSICSEVFNCSAGYSYDWELSTDGFNYSSVVAGSCLSTLMPSQQNLWVRLTVRCFDGSSFTTNHYITNSTSEYCKLCEETSVLKQAITNLQVYPNPSTGDVFVSFKGLGIGDKNIQITNALGEITYSEVNHSTRGAHLATNLPAGTYWITVQHGEQIFRTALIIK